MTISQLKDKSGNNIVSAGNVGYPDTSTSTSLASGTTYTASANGHVKSHGAVAYNDVQVLTHTLFKISVDTDRSFDIHLANFVKKGSSYKVVFPSGGGGEFIPDLET